MKNINDLLNENKKVQDNVTAGSAPVKPNDVKQTTETGVEVADVLRLKMEELRQKDKEEELKHKAQTTGLGYVNLKGVPIPGETLQMIDLSVVKEKQVICFYYAEHAVARLATTKEEPAEILKLKNELSFLEVPIEIFLTSAVSFDSALKQYEALPKIKPTPRGVEIAAEDLNKFSSAISDLSSIDKLLKNASMTEVVAAVIAAGLKTKASDIHIEAEADGIKLRYRIDGVLHTASILERQVWQYLISRLKLLSGLKLNIADKPQDGRFSILMKDDKVDVRVSCLPTNYGESVVLRLLLARMGSLKLEDLGLGKSYYQILSEQIKRPNGMIITTGPTGSGKTTTLYAILNQLNTSDTKIITIEDPIEYELEGVNQSQVDPAHDYTFAKGLRSIVRQDPDIIMVGEMRDLETVDIALNAALTGHLVLSTLHTNDAAGAIPRFLAMGAKTYLLAPALNLIIAQRLVRKLCEKCKKEIVLDEETKAKVLSIWGNGTQAEMAGVEIKTVKFYGPGGCEACNQIGYQGRIGIFEMFAMSKEVEQVILSNEVSEYKIRELAVKAGMLTLSQDGLLKAVKGITSVEEVLRLAG